jgi:hypothetical protein
MPAFHRLGAIWQNDLAAQDHSPDSKWVSKGGLYFSGPKQQVLKHEFGVVFVARYLLANFIKRVWLPDV